MLTKGSKMSNDERKYWYNSSTGAVEYGMVSPAADRVGPFDTEAEAARAPEKLRERSKAWSDDEEAEDDWGRGTKGDGE